MVGGSGGCGPPMTVYVGTGAALVCGLELLLVINVDAPQLEVADAAGKVDCADDGGMGGCGGGGSKLCGPGVMPAMAYGMRL